MKINREHCTRMTLIAVLALFTLLLIGSEHRKEAAAAAPETVAAAAMTSELPAERRGEWQNAARINPLWLLEVVSEAAR